MSKAVIFYVVSALAMAVVFQNCSRAHFSASSSNSSSTREPSASGEPVDQTPPVVTTPPSVTEPPTVTTPTANTVVGSIVAIADPIKPAKGTVSTVSVTSTNLTSATYACSALGGTLGIASGSLVNGNGSFPINVGQDVTCVFTGQGTNLSGPVKTTLNISVDCGAQVKTAEGQCVTFGCQTFQIISASDLMNIKPRDASMVCYAYKVLNAVPFGPSVSSTPRDPEVTTRDNDNDVGSASSAANHPFILGSNRVQFQMIAARPVFLTGGPDLTTPLRVDDLLLEGIFPGDSTLNVRDIFRFHGIGDVDQNFTLSASGSVAFRGFQFPVDAYTRGQTAVIKPLDVSASAPAGKALTLDIRALDTGGSRELSDVWLVFE